MISITFPNLELAIHTQKDGQCIVGINCHAPIGLNVDGNVEFGVALTRVQLMKLGEMLCVEGVYAPEYDVSTNITD